MPTKKAAWLRTQEKEPGTRHETTTTTPPTTTAAAASSPPRIPAGDRAVHARFPAMKAVTAMAHEGGLDLVFASELFDALGFGWELEEYDLRRINALLPQTDEALPSWLLSTFRDAMRTEIVLANYGMIPRHAFFIADALPAANRLQRLVIHYADFGDDGVEAIARALCDKNVGLKDVHLVGVEMGDRGAAAVADAMASPRCSVSLWNLETNRIADGGARAIAAALEAKSSTTLLQLSDNFISEDGIDAIKQIAKVRGLRTCRLKMRRGGMPPLGDAKELRLQMKTVAVVEQHASRVTELEMAADFY